MRGRHRGLVLDGGAHDDRVHRAHVVGGGGPDRAIDASAAAIGSRLRARSGVNEKKNNSATDLSCVRACPGTSSPRARGPGIDGRRCRIGNAFSL